MEDNTNIESDVELAEAVLGAFDDDWDEDLISESETDESEGHEDAQPDDRPAEETEEHEEPAEEPGEETEAGNQRFKINYLGNEEELTLDEMTTLAQKGRDYDHVRQERDKLKSEAKRNNDFLQKLADRAGLTIDDQIALTEAMWLKDEEEEKGNTLTDAEAVLRVQRRRQEQETETTAETDNEIPPEVKAFVEEYPDVKAQDIPSEVWEEARRTKNLIGAYQKHQLKLKDAEIEKLKKSVHNERNSQRSTGPRSTSGANRKKDDFDEGWDSEF